jgi:putative PIN family toxin of toxin-antitoxin system
VKVVLDTNVLLAAYGFGGVCLELTELCLRQHDVALSEHILGEFQKHLRDKFRISERQAMAISNRFRSGVVCVVPSPVSPEAFSDPTDLPVLGTLQAADADCLVTGDKGLLALGEFNGRPILSPRQFLDRLPRPAPPADL